MNKAGVIPPEDWNRLEGHFRELAIQPSADIGLVRNTTGTILFLRQSGGGAVTYRPFQLVATTDESSEDKIRVVRSTIAGLPPDEYSGSEFVESDDPPYLLTPVGTEGVVYVHVVVNQAVGGGDITARTIEIAATLPESTDTDTYAELGTYTYEVPEGAEDPVLVVQNSIYGPVSVTICRQWYAAESPYWGVSLTFDYGYY